MTDIRKHRRVLDTFTGPVERPVLRWLAAHMPAWVNPDILTGIGVFGALVILVGYLMTQYHPAFLWLASLGFVINWFGDSLDGTLARFRKIERPVYGFYIDHVVDAYCETLIFVGLGLSILVRIEIALLALVGYLLLSIMVYVYTCVQGEFKLSYGGLGPTEARLIGIGSNTLVFFVGNPALPVFGLNLTVYDWAVVGIILLEASIILTSTISQARRLARLEKATGNPEN
jgi:phosphatidylglycerophosphate synthase